MKTKNIKILSTQMPDRHRNKSNHFIVIFTPTVLLIVSDYLNTRAAPKVMPPILLCWWYASRGWTFPPKSYYMLWPCNRWQQRGTLTKWHLTWKCIWSKGVTLNSSMQKNGTHWHSLMFVEHLWRPNSACEYTEVLSGAVHWWQQQWVTSHGTDL